MLSPCSPLNSLEHLESECCLDAFSIATNESDASQKSFADTAATSPAASCSTHQETPVDEQPGSLTCSTDKDARTGSSSCLTAHARFQKALLELMSDKGMSLIEGPGGVGARSSRGPCRTTSKCRGVTKHRRTEKWEAHFWHHGKQLYLGGFQSESCAAKAHDIIALKCRGKTAETNYMLENYVTVLDLLPHITKDELIRLVRRQSCSSAAATAKGRPASKKAVVAKKPEPMAASPSSQTPSRRSSRIQVRSSTAGADLQNVKQLLSEMADSTRSDHSRHNVAGSPEPHLGNQTGLDILPAVLGYTKVVPVRQRSLQVALPPTPQTDAVALEPGSALLNGAASPYLSPLSSAPMQSPTSTACLTPPPQEHMLHSRKPNLPPLHLNIPSQQSYSPSPYSSLSCNTSNLLSQSPVTSTSTHMVWPSPQSTGMSNPAALTNNILSSQINLTQQIRLCRQANLNVVAPDMRSRYPANMPSLPYSAVYDMYSAGGGGLGVASSSAQAQAGAYAAHQMLMPHSTEAIPGLLTLQQQQSLLLASLQQQQQQQHDLSQQLQQRERQQQSSMFQSMTLQSSVPQSTSLMGMEDSLMLDSMLQEHFTNLPSVGGLNAGSNAGPCQGSVPRGHTGAPAWATHHSCDMGQADMAGLMGMGALSSGADRLPSIKLESDVHNMHARLKVEEPAALMAGAQEEEHQDVFHALDCPPSPLLVYTELQDSLNW